MVSCWWWCLLLVVVLLVMLLLWVVLGDSLTSPPDAPHGPHPPRHGFALLIVQPLQQRRLLLLPFPAACCRFRR